MILEKGKKAFLCIGAIVMPVITAGALFVGTRNSIRPSSATGDPLVLNSTNQPVISNNTATRVDEKNITWEYSGVQDFAGGHVTLKHQGYFGVSSSSAWGITQITSITANFAANNNELWLLKSVDGITWGEDCILESGTAVTTANNWRYIRFYCWSDSNTAVDITSVSISYGCSGVSATEDVDCAKAANVKEVTSNITYEEQSATISPNSVGGKALSFTKTDSTNTELTLGFGATYKISEIQNAKIEFDMKTSYIGYGKTIVMMNADGTVGSTIYSNKCTSYKCDLISGTTDWYHIQVPVTAMISTISGIWVDGTAKDKPHTDVGNKEVDRIKINAGTCVIDNLRISSSSCDLGIFNNPTYKPTVNEYYWLKTSWVGVLHKEQVTMSFSPSDMADHIPITYSDLMFESPFYLQWLKAGTCTITCNVVCGYNRQLKTVQFTVTVS